MPNKKKCLKRSLAIIACVAFVSMSLPGFTHAATKSSSKEFLDPEKLYSLISPFLSLISHDFSLGLYDSATAYCFSDNDKKPPAEKQEGKEKQKNKSTYDKNGNSTSRKRANGRD